MRFILPDSARAVDFDQEDAIQWALARLFGSEARVTSFRRRDDMAAMNRTIARLSTVALTLAALMLCLAASVRAQARPIDLERSKLTVLVYKSGLFSAFADDHVISAPLASGTISEDAPLAVQIAVRAGSLKVLDPNLADSKRAEVQTRMLSAEVLDTEKYADITFASSAVSPAGSDKWTVTGQLTIHGQTKSVTFPVTRQNGTYRGTVPLKQRDFGIQPISIAGGTVKVKDELKVQFEIVPASKP